MCLASIHAPRGDGFYGPAGWVIWDGPEGNGIDHEQITEAQHAYEWEMGNYDGYCQQVA